MRMCSTEGCGEDVFERGKFCYRCTHSLLATAKHMLEEGWSVQMVCDRLGTSSGVLTKHKVKRGVEWKGVVANKKGKLEVCVHCGKIPTRAISAVCRKCRDTAAEKARNMLMLGTYRMSDITTAFYPLTGQFFYNRGLTYKAFHHGNICRTTAKGKRVIQLKDAKSLKEAVEAVGYSSTQSAAKSRGFTKASELLQHLLRSQARSLEHRDFTRLIHGVNTAEIKKLRKAGIKAFKNHLVIDDKSYPLRENIISFYTRPIETVKKLAPDIKKYLTSDRNGVDYKPEED